MSELTIKSTTTTYTGWSKDIEFEREGKTHLVTLYWNDLDGYDIVFKNKTGTTPAWAWKMIEADTDDEGERVLECDLTSVVWTSNMECQFLNCLSDDELKLFESDIAEAISTVIKFWER